MNTLPDITPVHPAGHRLATWIRPKKIGAAALLLGVSAAALCAPHTPGNLFGGVLHARGPHGVYTEIRCEPHGLVALGHEPHRCVVHARLVRGHPHRGRY